MSCNLIACALILAAYASALPATPLLPSFVLVLVLVLVFVLEVDVSNPSFTPIFLNIK